MRLTLLATSLLISVGAASAQYDPEEPIQVYTECIGQKADGTYFAWFGYGNNNIFRNADGSLATDADGDPIAVEIPVGFENGYGDSQPNGQTTVFKPGPGRFSHRLEFTGQSPFMRSGTLDDEDETPVRFSYWWLRTPGQDNHRRAAFYTKTFGPTADSECLYDSFADVELAFELSDPSPEVGESVEGTVTLTNVGTIAATTLHVQHHLPDGVAYAVADGTAEAPNPSLGTIDPVHGWTVESLAPGESVTMRVVMSADAEGSYAGFFEVECQDQDDLDSRPADQDPQEDDYAAVSFTTVSTSSGNDGGLESDGALATVIARRDVSRMLRRADDARLGRADAPLVMLSAAPQAKTAASYTSDLDMRSLLPETGPGASTAYVTTPEDLLQITNAQAILSADYLQEDGDRVGAILAVLTPPGETYDHTKAICDRVKGSRLESVRTVDGYGQRFVLLEVSRPDGSVDYAISVVAYPTPDGYTLDSRFRAEEYAIEQGQAADVLNVQAWASTPEAALALVRGLVRELDAYTTLEARNWGATMPTVPTVFVRGGEYAPGRLLLDVANTTDAPQSIRLSGTTTDVEQGERAAFERTLTVPADGLVTEVETGAIFDAGFSVVADGRDGEPTVADFVYLADGVWTFTSGDAADALEYAVMAGSTERGHNARPVERDARLAGTTGTWAGLFRSINPGSRPADLSGFSALAFEARGQGRVQVVVEKTSTNGVEPFHAWVDLDDAVQTVTLPFSDLRRAGGQGGFTADDVTLVAFYVYNDGGSPESFEIDVRGLRFENSQAVSTDGNAEAALELGVAPNPSRGDARVRFTLPMASAVSVEVYDLLGRRVATLADGAHSAGDHALDVPTTLAAGTYLVRLQAGTEQLVQRITRLP